MATVTTTRPATTSGPANAPRPSTGMGIPTSPESDRRAELAAFLRNRRERLTPEELGIAAFGRRRTPGLRREEVAGLAGVGVTWYTWLEQGRDITPSRSVLNALARCLMLDAHERRHLFSLAKVPIGDATACHAVQDSTLAVLTQLEPFPATIQNPRFDILALNRGFAWLMPELLAEPVETRNILRLAFTNPSLRARLTSSSVERMVATFRGAMAENVANPAFKEMLEDLLTASPEFASTWERHDVMLPENMHKQFRHETGLLQFQHTTMWSAPRGGGRIIALIPADTVTRDLLDHHVGRADATPTSVGPPEPVLAEQLIDA